MAEEEEPPHPPPHIAPVPQRRKEEEAAAMLTYFLLLFHRSCLPVWRPNGRPSAGTWYPPSFQDKLKKPVG